MRLGPSGVAFDQEGGPPGVEARLRAVGAEAPAGRLVLLEPRVVLEGEVLPADELVRPVVVRVLRDQRFVQVDGPGAVFGPDRNGRLDHEALAGRDVAGQPRCAFEVRGWIPA